MKKALLLFSAFTAFCFTAKAVVPTWSVEPSVNFYQNTMTVTAVLDINCVESTDANDKVAAFVNGTCRGVANASSVVQGRNIAFLTIYSNASSGETIVFQFYDASADVVYTANNSLQFSSDASYGFPTSPYVITNNYRPTAIALTPASVVEEQATGTTVGTLTSTDADVGNTFTYTFATGTGDQDNGSFTISGDQLLTAVVFDYETQASYSVVVQTTDNNGCSYTQQITITIIDGNDAPTALSLSPTTVNENLPAGTTIGTFTTSDTDPNDVFTYTFATGTGDQDNGSFTINGSNLETAGAFDFEAQSSYSVLVTTDDGNGGTFTQQFTITVNNTNDAPTALALSNNTVNENSLTNTTVGSFSTTDEDVSDVHTYTLVPGLGGEDNGAFTIVSNQLRTATTFDFEVDDTYSVLVETNDGNGGTFIQQFTITINDINDIPTALALSNNTVNENATVSSVVGQFSTTDQDAADVHVYTFVSGPGGEGNGSFNILGDELRTATLLDYELQQTYSVLIKTDDGNGGTFTQQFTIYVTNDNDAPTTLTLTVANTNGVPENSPIGTYVGFFASADQDTADVLTYSFTSGTGDVDNAKFSISGTQLLTAADIDYETQSSFSVLVAVNDGNGGTLTQQFTITAEDVNDAHTATSETFNATENSQSGTVVGTVAVTDDDTQGYVFSILNTETLPFEIDNSTGEITVTGKLDYETVNSYTLQIRVLDDEGQYADTAEIVVLVNDMIESYILPCNTYISPNGDGKNDLWVIENVDLYASYEIIIYDSFGSQIFQKDSGYQNEFDGTIKGKLLPDGAYYYFLKSTDDTLPEFKGTISLNK